MSVKILHIVSSALVETSLSRRLSSELVDEWRKTDPDLHVTFRDLSADPIPHVGQDFVTGLTLPDAERSPEQRAAIQRSDQLVAELLDADVLVIGVPMYNFTIPSTLKAWIDHITRAGKTFNYTGLGPRGLLSGKKAFVLASRGGAYGSEEGRKVDFQESYLRTMLGFLGIEDVEFVFAEGQRSNARTTTEGVQAARKAIAEIAGSGRAFTPPKPPERRPTWKALAYFATFNLLPIAGTAAALVFAIWHPPTALDITLFVVLWLATGLGLTSGFHRLFTHRAFKTTTAVRAVLAALGCMAGQNGPIAWVAIHRRHHECSDKSGDMHSPNLHGSGMRGRLKGIAHAHIAWMINPKVPDVTIYARDLLRDPVVTAIDRRRVWFVLLGLAVPALIGGLVTQSLLGAFTGFLWGGVVRLFVVANSMWMVNSMLHLGGRRPFVTKDKSGNSAILAALIWGEGWHNNHHAFPTSASFGLAWYRIDAGYWLIRLLAAAGLAWDVQVPSPTRLLVRQQESVSGTA